MYLMIDNYDSFVYNLKAYIDELNEEVMVIRNDKLTIKEIAKMKNLRGIIISPGPKSPKDCGICTEVVRKFSGKIPILGVCLGHQIIGMNLEQLLKREKSQCMEKYQRFFIINLIFSKILKVHML